MRFFTTACPGIRRGVSKAVFPLSPLCEKTQTIWHWTVSYLILMVKESQRGGVLKYTTMTGFFVQDEPCTNGSILNQASLDEIFLLHFGWGRARRLFAWVCVNKHNPKCPPSRLAASSVRHCFAPFWCQESYDRCLSRKNEKQKFQHRPLFEILLWLLLIALNHSRQRPTSVW